MVSQAVLPSILRCQSGVIEFCSDGANSPCRHDIYSVTGLARPTLAVVSAFDGDAIGKGLARHQGCVERSFRGLMTGGNLVPVLDLGGLYLGLTTSTAYGVELARLFCAELAGRLGLSQDLRESMELALHEALVNGMIHGNLEIRSAGRETLELFAEYCLAVESGLADPQRGGRLIEVFAVWDDHGINLAVVDDGQGYDPSELTLAEGQYHTSGRGLKLISSLSQSVSVSDGGRKLTMRFPR